MRIRWLLLAAATALLLVSGACSDSDSNTGTGSGNSRQVQTQPRDNSLGGGFGSHQRYGGQHIGGTASGDTEAGAAFARWVLEQDPQRQYYTDAVVRNEQSLGIKVQPTVSKGDVQRLLVALTEGMARTFPGKPLQVIAFFQSGDKLAEANYDPRRNDVDVRFVQ